MTGVLLPKLCKDQETNIRRAMSQISSSGVAYAREDQISAAAYGPASLHRLGRELYSSAADAPAPL